MGLELAKHAKLASQVASKSLLAFTSQHWALQTHTTTSHPALCVCVCACVLGIELLSYELFLQHLFIKKAKKK